MIAFTFLNQTRGKRDNFAKFYTRLDCVKHTLNITYTLQHARALKRIIYIIFSYFFLLIFIDIKFKFNLLSINIKTKQYTREFTAVTERKVFERLEAPDKIRCPGGGNVH